MGKRKASQSFGKKKQDKNNDTGESMERKVNSRNGVIKESGGKEHVKSGSGSCIVILIGLFSVAMVTVAVIYANEDAQATVVGLARKHLPASLQDTVGLSKLDLSEQSSHKETRTERENVKDSGVEVEPIEEIVEEEIKIVQDDSVKVKQEEDVSKEVKVNVEKEVVKEEVVPEVKAKPQVKKVKETVDKPVQEKAQEKLKKEEVEVKQKDEVKIEQEVKTSEQEVNKDEAKETVQKPVEEKSKEGEKTDDQKPAEGEKKSKPKRKDYVKNDITNKADYKIRKRLDEADDLLDKDDVEGAIVKFDSILKKHPDSPRAMYGKGLSKDKLAEKQRSNEHLEEGIRILDNMIRLPDVPSVLLERAGRNLADRQSFRGWSNKAVKTWKFLIENFPSNLDLKNQLGVSYLMTGQNENARQTFKEVLAADPKDGFALVHLGFILKATDNNPAEAIPLLTAGIESGAPGTLDGRFFFQLGDSLQRTNQTQEAKRIYQLGADKGLFLSADQRSLYNTNGLTGRPWWTLKQTGHEKELQMLEKNWKIIRDEGLAQLDPKTGSFVPEEENLRETGDWKQFTLYQRGQKNKENCAKAPKTCALIDQIPDAKGCKRGQLPKTSVLTPVTEASALLVDTQVKYSVMHGGVHVWPHCGPTNCRIRAHLGLVVPEGPRIRVANNTRTWKEGKFIIFDDSFEHEVWHDGTETRLVLIVDLWHPELNEMQKRQLSPI